MTATSTVIRLPLRAQPSAVSNVLPTSYDIGRVIREFVRTERYTR